MLLGVGLQRVVEGFEPARHGVFTDRVALGEELVADLIGRFTAPLQQRHRIAGGGLLQELLQ
jgi:hypothetical protein